MYWHVTQDETEFSGMGLWVTQETLFRWGILSPSKTLAEDFCRLSVCLRKGRRSRTAYILAAARQSSTVDGPGLPDPSECSDGRQMLKLHCPCLHNTRYTITSAWTIRSRLCLEKSLKGFQSPQFRSVGAC